MNRKDFLKFLFEETRRLVDEELVHALRIAGRYNQLENIACNIPKNVEEYLVDYTPIIKCSEIPREHAYAIAMWLNYVRRNAASLTFWDIQDDFFFENPLKFAELLVKEAGDAGKSIAFHMKNGKDIATIKKSDFFTEKFAKDYDEMIATKRKTA